MFRLWAKEFKDNRMLRDTTICDDSDETRTHKVTCLIWENRSGWNTILMSLNVMQKLVFTRIVLLNRLILIFWRFR